MPRVIEPVDAAAMIQSGEWLHEDVVFDRLVSSAAQATVDKTIAGGGEYDPAAMKAVVVALDQWIPEIVECRAVAAAPPRPGSIELSLGRGRIFRARAAADDAVVAICTLVVGFLTAPIGSVLFFASSIPALVIARRLAKHYEVLEGREREVFEAVVALGGELSVVNYDALQKKDYEAAFGIVNPITAQVAARLGRPEPEILATLRALRQREIVIDRDGHWGVAF